MAYTTLSQLSVMTSGLQLEICTPQEDSASISFYANDITLVNNQSGCVSSGKRMATFWGLRRLVWVGFDRNGDPLNIIALQCPPYYPPYTSEGQQEFASPIPNGFPG